jgi:hypothetical protein
MNPLITFGKCVLKTEYLQRCGGGNLKFFANLIILHEVSPLRIVIYRYQMPCLNTMMCHGTRHGSHAKIVWRDEGSLLFGQGSDQWRERGSTLKGRRDIESRHGSNIIYMIVRALRNACLRDIRRNSGIPRRRARFQMSKGLVW